jgi:Galactose oxidase, central domain
MMAQLFWTQKQDIGPMARDGVAMEYDVARSRVVLFGGNVGGIANDTWEWDGEYWTQTADIGPPLRRNHALAYDSNRERLVMFGGTSSGLQDTLADTWEWDGEDWTQVADSGPKARMSHSMSYDSKGQRVLLFGGVTDLEGGLMNLDDTWSWNGFEWTEEEASGPEARNGHKMAYDSVRDRVVLFGGVTATRDVNDTWSTTAHYGLSSTKLALSHGPLSVWFALVQA